MSAAEVIGYGMHPFGRFPGKLPSEMAEAAVHGALESAGLGPGDIEIVYTGHTVAESGGGAAVLAASGLSGMPVLNIDQACASSATAAVLACMALEAGQYTTALVVGFEKMGHGFLRQDHPHGRSEQLLGLDSQPVRYALKASRYLDIYGGEDEMLAAVTVKSRRHAALNENAHLQGLTSVEEVLSSPVISTPLTRLQCCPTSDGAAAIVLSSRTSGTVRRYAKITGWSLGTIRPEEVRGAGVPEAFTARLARAAYERAGIGPDDIGVAQVHDAFSIAEPLRLEALGLVPEGEGLRWTVKGETSLGGSIPTNTDGGLLSRGHPVGATGVAQLIEVVRQLTESAGARQMERAPAAGICQNIGGGENGGGVVTVLSR